MSIFGRRVLQRLINENAQFMSNAQIARHVRLLNLNDRRGASTEWEVVLLNSFSKLARVQYEPALGGSSRPDLLVSPHGAIEPFVAEITSVSDAGYDNDNPFREFESAFEKLAKKKHLSLGGFHFRIGGEDIGEFPEQKTRLLLPPKHELERFISETFTDFLERIALEPEKAHSHSHRDSHTSVTTTYNPKNRETSGASFPSYTSLKARETNTLYKALANKAKTLKGSGYKGTRGIIVCDGGASYLSDTSSGVTSFSLRTIVGNFFRKHSSVSFIMIVRTILSRDLGSSRHTLELSREIFLNGYLPDSPHEAALAGILYASIDTAPRPKRLAINAWRQVPASHRLLAHSRYGGGSLSSRQVKISARTVQALLAGLLPQTQFQASHKDFARFLDGTLKQGRSIIGARVEVSANDDDDWLILEFGEPDPAIRPFISPIFKSGS